MNPDGLVIVIFDEKKRRPRVRSVKDGGWVRFPKALRSPGALYRVERLTPLPGGSWNAGGKIRRLA